ncbi:unnamed protein product [Prorocentrum cordatum]|uniref:Uncharacterized protein n=1 Tax=Prorocentrum cordatum TaxID=2364126 RepID=A0ABN9QQ01_9DINO|nr:unnamed protein product [Polarella glacialis]
MEFVESMTGFSLEVLISKIASLGIVGGSLVGRCPQIKLIWESRSAEGISFLGLWTEAYTLGVTFAYNLVLGTPITTYGEIPIIFTQMLVEDMHIRCLSLINFSLCAIILSQFFIFGTWRNGGDELAGKVHKPD